VEAKRNNDAKSSGDNKDAADAESKGGGGAGNAAVRRTIYDSQW
jgi:hypothetical protein